MKSIHVQLLVFLFTVIALGLCSNTATAQQINPKINTTVNINEYDILFLTDILDAKTQKLNSAASGFSVDLSLEPSAASQGPSFIRIYMEILVQLRGDAQSGLLIRGHSNDIPFNRNRTLTARDFVKAAGGIAVLVGPDYYENSIIKKKMTDFAQTTSAAPPGTYKITVNAIPQGATTPSPYYGTDSKTIVIPYSGTDEVFVEINDPKNGSCFSNLAPTFSWTSAEPNVTVRVFEAGLNHRTPQDAITASNPCLEENVIGGNTLTYPSNAKRQLQENRAYVVQVEAKVSTSSGPMKNISQPVVFRISDDHFGKILDNFFSSISGNASSTFSTLRADPSNWIPWPRYGNITLNGSILSESDLQILLNELAAQQDLKLELRVENQ
jgi:hypothetical protein